MNVTSASAAPVVSASSGSGGGDIARLQKRVQELTNELRSVATSDMEAKAKITKTKLLQAMIQMLQQQIAAVQQQGQQAQALQQQKAAEAAQKAAPTASTASARKPAGALGATLDTYA
ncbi:FlxA-like family protein [Xylophilus ampelinus]|uniref:FlxA-like protein n=1 Tax=Xylophilus ampelinus TaxID=54067 RepID=A0A318SKW2_9BURK|nr:FlxA-like family protein [Xylophilus ampelinus]MCS4510867.1 FlxA-like family protein [Xylophilus ampelinus]PYE76152.1 FlxA-like protein [Xylophilus ampelinus]